MSAVAASILLRSAALRSGVRVPVAGRGGEPGVPVMLLHGLTDSWRSFDGVMRRLPASIRAFAPSMRGHGEADGPEAGYQPADFADDAAALLDALGIARAPPSWTTRWARRSRYASRRSTRTAWAASS